MGALVGASPAGIGAETSPRTSPSMAVPRVTPQRHDTVEGAAIGEAVFAATGPVRGRVHRHCWSMGCPRAVWDPPAIEKPWQVPGGRRRTGDRAQPPARATSTGPAGRPASSTTMTGVTMHASRVELSSPPMITIASGE